MRVGVSVTACLRWGHGCGCPKVLGCITLDARVRTVASAPCLFDSAVQGGAGGGRAGPAVTELLAGFCWVIGGDKEAVTPLLWLVRSGDLYQQ